MIRLFVHQCDIQRVTLASELVNDTVHSLCGHDVKHESLPKKVMAVAHSVVSYVPGSAACMLHKIATCLIDTALLVWLFLCLANSGQKALSEAHVLTLHVTMNVVLSLNGLLNNNLNGFTL